MNDNLIPLNAAYDLWLESELSHEVEGCACKNCTTFRKVVRGIAIALGRPSPYDFIDEQEVKTKPVDLSLQRPKSYDRRNPYT